MATLSSTRVGMRDFSILSFCIYYFLSSMLYVMNSCLLLIIIMIMVSDVFKMLVPLDTSSDIYSGLVLEMKLLPDLVNTCKYRI